MDAQNIATMAVKTRIYRIQEVLKSLDGYCEKEHDPVFQNKAREAVDETIAGMYGYKKATPSGGIE